MTPNQRKEIERLILARDTETYAPSAALKEERVRDWLYENRHALLSALDAAEARAAELQAENESLKRRVQDEIRRSDDSRAHYAAAELRTKDAKARAVAAEDRVRELEGALAKQKDLSRRIAESASESMNEQRRQLAPESYGRGERERGYF